MDRSEIIKKSIDKCVILYQYNFKEQMKEDSLLSSLSNVSYYGNHPHSDFFNDSAPVGGHPELKIKPPKEQEQVDLNYLPAFNHNEPVTPKQTGLLMAGYWTADNNLMQGHSENGSQFADQEMQLEPQLIKIVSHKQKNQQKEEKVEEPSNSNSDDQIGTTIKNETKNIPKNYGKAIITYIQKQHHNFQEVLKKCGIEYDQLLAEVTKKKKYINTIANLRDLWMDFKYARCMRILSNQFLRKHALQYIFNSRICNYTSHVKYRKRLRQAIEAPGGFSHIKQY